MRYQGVKGQAGTVLAETSISMVLFLLVILGGFQIVLCAYKEAVLRQALQKASRYVALGMAGDNLENVRAKVEEYSQLKISSANFSACALSDVNGIVSCNNGLGVSGQWVKLQAKTTLPTIFGRYKITVSGSTLAKNEPNSWQSSL